MAKEKKGNPDKLPAKVGEYNGSPTISLPLGETGRFQFTFGLSKAKAILDYIDDIKKFVAENEKEAAA